MEPSNREFPEKMPEKPDDLGIKIGSEDEKYWSEIKKEAEKNKTSSIRNIEQCEVIIALADKRIAEEKVKFK